MIVATLNINFKFMIKNLIVGYSIALFSEYTSITKDFPIKVFGEYYYIQEGLQNEILFFGVPIWDSVSFVFMCYSGLTATRIAKRKYIKFFINIYNIILHKLNILVKVLILLKKK